MFRKKFTNIVAKLQEKTQNKKKTVLKTSKNHKTKNYIYKKQKNMVKKQQKLAK